MSELDSKVDMAARLAEAVRSGAVTVHMQPEVSLPTLEVVGCEALARWTDPDLGRIPPDRFIHVAEKTGLIVQLGRHVLHQACTVAATWQHLPGGRFVSVNVSAVQLAEPDFVRHVAHELADSGLPPDQLVLELTETAALNDIAATAAQLTQLRAMGVRLALDDFGIGQSPLTLLSRLPFDVVKIERTFVADVHRRAHAAVVAKIVIEAAHSLGQRVCAEGIELHEQAQELAALGSDLAQGFLLARPYDPSTGELPDDVMAVRRPIDLTTPPPIQLGGSDELVVVTDAERRITYASLGCLHLLGYRPTELLGTDGRSYLHVDELHLLPPMNDPDRLGTHEIPRHRARHRDGSWRWFRTSIQVLTNPDGSLRETISTSRDITTEVETYDRNAELERQLRWAFEDAPIGMAMSTYDGVITQVNGSFARMLGYTVDDLSGRSIEEITHPQDRAQDVTNLHELRADPEVHQQVVKRYLHADGHPVSTRVRVLARPPTADRVGVVLAHIMPHDGAATPPMSGSAAP